MSFIAITGPMSSGKTTEMLKRMNVYADCVPESKCLIVASALDTREQKDGLSSHSSGYKGISDKIKVVAANRLSDVDVSKYTHIGIDECQFFPDLRDIVEEWIKENKNVVACGLDGTAEMKPFGQIAELLPYSDEFIKLTAICSLCVKEALREGKVLDISRLRAPFTKKIDKSNHKVIDIGGTDKYLAVCRAHFSRDVDFKNDIEKSENKQKTKSEEKKDGNSGAH